MTNRMLINLLKQEDKADAECLTFLRSLEYVTIEQALEQLENDDPMEFMSE